MINQNFLYNPELPRSHKFIDLKEFQAQRAARTTIGKGCYVNTANEQLRNDLNKIMTLWNDLDFLAYENEKICSAWGGSIIEINKTVDGTIKFNIAQIPVSKIAHIASTLTQAEIYSWYKYDDTGNGYIITTYTQNEVIRKFYSDPSYTILSSHQQKISKNLQLPLREQHNLGICPLVFFQNLPKKNQYGGQFSNLYADDVAVADLQELLDFTFETMWKEAEFNRTRVIGSITPQEIYQGVPKNNRADWDPMYRNQHTKLLNKLELLKSDFILNANISVPGSTSGSPIQILQGDPKLDVYINVIEWIIDAYTKGCGYSPSSEGNTQKTENEILFTKSAESETIELKRRLRKRKFKELLDKALMLLGWDESVRDEYSFELKDNQLANNLKSLETELMLVDYQLSSRVNVCMKMYGFSRDEAIKYLDEIDKDNIKYPIKSAISFQDEENTNPEKEANRKGLNVDNYGAMGNK